VGMKWHNMHCIIEAQMREMKNGIKISEQLIKLSRFQYALMIFVNDLLAVLEISSQDLTSQSNEYNLYNEISSGFRLISHTKSLKA
jgi:hypothetical protein